MKAYVQRKASGLLFVRVPLCSSVSFPFPCLYPPTPTLPGPSGMRREQEEIRAQGLPGLQRISVDQGTGFLGP